MMKMTIVNKLGIAFLLLILIFTFSGFMSINRLTSIEKNIREITEVHVPSTEAAMEMEINLIGTGFGLLGYLHDHDPEHLERLKKDKADFTEFLAIYHDLAGTQEAKELDRKMDVAYEEFKSLSDELIQLEDQQSTKISSFEQILFKIDEILDEKIQASVTPDEPYGQQKLQAAMELEINTNGIAKGLASYFLINLCQIF